MPRHQSIVIHLRVKLGVIELDVGGTRVRELGFIHLAAPSRRELDGVPEELQLPLAFIGLLLESPKRIIILNGFRMSLLYSLNQHPQKGPKSWVPMLTKLDTF